MWNQTWIPAVGAVALAALSATAHSSTAGLFHSPLALTEPASAAAPDDERNGFGPATLDVTGIPSMDSLGSPNNVVMYVWVGPFNQVTGLGWDVVLQTVAPGSRLSEIRTLFTDTINAPFTGVTFMPGVFDPIPGGPTAYSSDGAIVKFYQENIPNLPARADGFIRVEFFDHPDNAVGTIDGLWVSGSLRFQTLFAIPPIPGPHVPGLLMLAGTLSLSRRRRG